MQKRCAKCGNELDELTGKCPVCDKQLSKKEIKKSKKEEKKLAKKMKKKERWKQLSFGQKFKKICIRFFVTVLVVALLVGSGAATLVYFNVVDIPAISGVFAFFGVDTKKADGVIKSDADEAKKLEEAKNERTKELEALDNEIQSAESGLKDTSIDAESYFQNNSTVISQTDVNASAQVHTESEVYNIMQERGFGDEIIETSYSMSGEYYTAKAISGTSSEKHPIYQTTYTTQDGDFWMIFEINGVIMASPVSNSSTQILLSESEAIMSYDSRSNKFFETVPNESQIVVKTLERIDAEALEIF